MAKPILLALLSIALISGMVLNANAQPSQKYAMFVFDDNPIGEYSYAKPILDQYGYKASFMVVCNWVNTGNNPIRMSWDQIAQLGLDGMDIESHTMTHPNLNHLTAQQLNFELNGSKHCLMQHGYNPVAFSYPRGFGTDNATVVNSVAQYYSIGKTFAPIGTLQFLNCQGYQAPANQTNCATFSPSGKPQNDSSLVLRSHSIDGLENATGYNDTAVFGDVVSWLKEQNQYNSQGQVMAIPIIALHEIVNKTTHSFWLNTNVNLFNQTVRYLHNNNYQVITLKDLGYNEMTKTLYIKQIQSQTQTIGSILTTNHISWPKTGTNMIISGKLTDTNGVCLANQKIVFTGNGAKNIWNTYTKSDGTFSSIGIAPTVKPNTLKWNEYQINAIYTGDSQHSSSLSIVYFAVN